MQLFEFLSQQLVDAKKEVRLAKQKTKNASHSETDQVPAASDSLRAKLVEVDDKYKVRSEEQLETLKVAMNKRVEDYQKTCQQRCAEELDLEKTRFVREERLKIQLEEREKHQIQFSEAKQQMEENVNLRMVDMDRKEKESLQRIRKKEQDAEQALYESRQRVLESMARASALEADTKREAAVGSRTMRMQAESARNVEEQLAMREAALEGLKDHYANKLNDDIERYQSGLSYPFL